VDGLPGAAQQLGFPVRTQRARLALALHSDRAQPTEECEVKRVLMIPFAIFCVVATSVSLRPTGDVSAMNKEVIEVYSCNPGYQELGSGENMTCIPEDLGGSGGGTGIPPSGGDGGGGGGGGNGGRPTSPLAEEMARKNRCKQCKAASEKCLNQAILASSTCTENARTMAESRCEFTGGQEGNTVTSWAHPGFGWLPDERDARRVSSDCDGGQSVVRSALARHRSVPAAAWA
jgi:hypothetical protein